MTDRKTVSRITSKRRTIVKVPRALPLNEMIYQARWTEANLTTGTTGTISRAQLSPTIQNSSEYSAVQGLFSMVKCIKAVWTFTGRLQNGSVGHGRIMVGTDNTMNYTTNTTPTSYTDVQNLERKKDICTYTVIPVSYRQAVPKNLDFSNLDADAPTLPTPFAGSPGVVKVFSQGLTNSQDYFFVDAVVTYHLKGRR